ncbi:MAG: hypothetical protein E7473_00030 [Ruminococcaceae bacterium]|nr:hypothetical protein [Oscillospiraceae bacterium]
MKNPLFEPSQEKTCKWFAPTEKPFVLTGFPFYDTDGIYRRYPLNPPEELPVKVEDNARGSSGGQIRFSAKTSQLRLRVKLREVPLHGYHITTLAEAGFDVYAAKKDGNYVFCGVTKFEPAETEYKATLIQLENAQELDFIINFPLRTPVESVLVGLDEKCVPTSPPSFSKDSRILIYGASIMHGFCASRPGMTMANIISRRLNREVINMGVNGSALCETSVAKSVRMVDNVSLLIINTEGNCPDDKFIAEYLPEFIEVYREVHPETPIAVMSFMRESREYIDDIARRRRLAKKEAQIKTVEAFKNSGDKNIYFWDGEDFTNEYEDIVFGGHCAGNECTVDTQHKSDLGFWLMANGVMRRIKELNI